MHTLQLGKTQVTFYDSIKTLPAGRFNEYQKFLMMEAGLRSAEEILLSLRELKVYHDAGQKQAEADGFENLVYAHFMRLMGQNPSQWAFAALIHSIDGKPLEDLNEETCIKVVNQLSDAGLTQIQLIDLLEELKKN